MLNTNSFLGDGTPLVRERSKVQSFPAAPKKPNNQGLLVPTPNSITAFRDATERERARSIRAESGRDVLESFEDWLDRQTLTPDGAEAADEIIRFLRRDDMPAPLVAGLADAVRRLATSLRPPYDTSAEPIDKPSIRQSERRQQCAAGGIAPPAGRMGERL